MLMQFGGIGLALMLILLVIAMRTSKRVLLSRDVPIEEIKIYVLPAAMMFIIALAAMVEDIISSTGKGTFVGLMYFSSLMICELHGKRLLDEYVRGGVENKNVIATARALPAK